MDATVVATPFYFGSMEAERRYLRARAAREGPSRADYERRDTITSLTMGVASLLAPMVMPRLLAPFTPGKGRYGKALVAGAIGSVAVTAIADRVARRAGADDDVADREPDGPAATRPRRPPSRVSRRGGIGRDRWHRDHDDLGVTLQRGPPVEAAGPPRPRRRARSGSRRRSSAGTSSTTGTTGSCTRAGTCGRSTSSTTRASATTSRPRCGSPSPTRSGPSCRTALLCLLGVRPGAGRLGPRRSTCSTSTGSTPTRSAGSARSKRCSTRRRTTVCTTARTSSTWTATTAASSSCGTGSSARSSARRDPVVYGLTKNINTFDPTRVIAHEHAEMLRDVRGSDTWRERLSFVVRGPGWAYRRHAELAAPATEGVAASAVLTGVAAAPLP